MLGLGNHFYREGVGANVNTTYMGGFLDPYLVSGG